VTDWRPRFDWTSLTMYPNAQLAAEVLRAGASGFIVKDGAGPEIIAALHAVLRGRT
jgi:DNA-binding NarL/FixJ family response regulator